MGWGVGRVAALGPCKDLEGGSSHFRKEVVTPDMEKWGSLLTPLGAEGTRCV